LKRLESSPHGAGIIIGKRWQAVLPGMPQRCLCTMKHL
jgi:hypothetical protein